MTDETSKPEASAEPEASVEPATDSATAPPQANPEPASATVESNAQASIQAPSNAVLHSRPAASRSGLLALMLALLALLCVLGAAAAGYLYSQNLENQRFSLEQELKSLQQTQAGLQIDIQGRSQWFDGMAERSSKLDRQIETLQEQQRADQAHQSQVDSALGKLAEQVQGGQQAWQRAEIEHLLLVANTRLQLQKDLSGAEVALKLAEERLQSLADPAYFSVRRQISDELTRLDAVVLPDVQALALKLASLTDQVDALPTRHTHRGAFKTDLNLSTVPQDMAWHQRLWLSLNEAVGSLVSIRRDVERREPLLPPDQNFYLRQNLRLQLESARLALLREDSANFKAALRQADTWLQQYFDLEHAATRAARSSIGNLSAQNITSSVPDISGSLKALRSVGRSS